MTYIDPYPRAYKYKIWYHGSDREFDDSGKIGMLLLHSGLKPKIRKNVTFQRLKSIVYFQKKFYLGNFRLCGTDTSTTLIKTIFIDIM